MAPTYSAIVISLSYETRELFRHQLTAVLLCRSSIGCRGGMSASEKTQLYILLEDVFAPVEIRCRIMRLSIELITPNMWRRFNDSQIALKLSWLPGDDFDIVPVTVQGLDNYRQSADT